MLQERLVIVCKLTVGWYWHFLWVKSPVRWLRRCFVCQCFYCSCWAFLCFVSNYCTEVQDQALGSLSKALFSCRSRGSTHVGPLSLSEVWVLSQLSSNLLLPVGRKESQKPLDYVYFHSLLPSYKHTHLFSHSTTWWSAQTYGRCVLNTQPEKCMLCYIPYLYMLSIHIVHIYKCVNSLSLKHTWDDPLVRRDGFVWLTGLEAPVHDWLAHCPEAARQGRSMWWSQAAPTVTIKPPAGHRLLKVPPHPNIAKSVIFGRHVRSKL
jgi:hypothetical protein